MLTKSRLGTFCAGLALAAFGFSASSLGADEGAGGDDVEAAIEVVGASEDAPEEKGEKTKSHVRGRIIIVEPDGTRREYNFGAPPHVVPPGLELGFDVEGALLAEPLRAVVKGQGLGEMHFKSRVTLGEYMIGLECAPADEALRAQLGLGERGLVVRSALEKSPAAEAGFQPHDVLLKAGDKDLSTVQDLLDAVQAADGNPLSITLLRGGQEQTIEVTPVKRASVTLAPEKDEIRHVELLLRNLRDHEEDVLRNAPLHELKLHTLRPGVVFEKKLLEAEEREDKVQDLESQVQKLAEQVESLQKSLDELKEKGN